MTLDDITKIPVLQTRHLAEDANEDPETLKYIVDCLLSCYTGDYGTVPPEDVEANNADLEEGYGHILARYKAKYKLTEDIYINIHFDRDHLDDVDYTNTMIMYCGDY